jgi:hypothetical protein
MNIMMQHKLLALEQFIIPSESFQGETPSTTKVTLLPVFEVSMAPVPSITMGCKFHRLPERDEIPRR